MRWQWILILALVQSVLASDHWLEFRGPNGQGISDSVGLPLNWSENRNIKWKSPLPGRGASSPVVLSNQIWLTTATEQEHSLRAVCLDRGSGRLLHDIELFRVETPESFNNPVSGLASPTPVAEPGRVYFSFGAYGNAAVDAQTGRVLWRNRDFNFNHDNCGPGSSPILYGSSYIISCDGIGLRCVVALNKNTGKATWQTHRPNRVIGPFASKSFSTPVLAKVHGQDQLLSLGPMRLGAYDPLDGRELWACDLSGWSMVARPVLGSNVVFVSSGGDVPELWAIRLDGQGAVRNSDVLWRYKRQIPMVSSPVLAGSQLYFASDAGLVTCLDARSGDPLWTERLARPIFASPLLAEGRIYWFSEEGTTIVTRPDTKLNILAQNKLDSGCLATPAIAGKAIYLRTKSHLYRIEE